MKKQLLAAAIASTVSAAALADISITGNAKYEYFSKETGTSPSTDTSNTEVNLSFKGKTGDTAVVLNMEFNSSGDVSTTDTDTRSSLTLTGLGTDTAKTATVGNVPGLGSAVYTYSEATTAANGTRGYLDIEDMYLTTKVGDVSVKAGNWVSGAGSLGGEIDVDTRSVNKVDMRTTLGGATIYAGNNGVSETAGEATLNRNMYAGVVFNAAGNKIEIKKVSDTRDAVGINGSIAGVNYRLEQIDDDTDNKTVFGNITTETNGISLGYAWIDADNVNTLSQDDSDIFAVEAGGSGYKTTSDGQKQITVSTSVDGNKVTVKSGTIDKGVSNSTDADYFQVGVSRKLASGATAAVIYTDKDTTTAGTSTESLEVELSVAF
jgi:hypothetical protein